MNVSRRGAHRATSNWRDVRPLRRRAPGWRDPPGQSRAEAGGFDLIRYDVRPARRQWPRLVEEHPPEAAGTLERGDHRGAVGLDAAA